MLDEAWVAWVDQGTMIQPTMARGLAWIDPNLSPRPRGPAPAGSDLREALAWRWIAEAADARVDRQAHRAGTGRLDSRPCADRSRAPASRCSTADSGVRGRRSARLGSALDRPGRRLARALALQRPCRHRRSRRGRSTSPTARGSGFPKEGLARSLDRQDTLSDRKNHSFSCGILVEEPWLDSLGLALARLPVARAWSSSRRPP